MWHDLNSPWQLAFGQGWQAYIEGSVPIGAVLYDETGRLLGVARNGRSRKDARNPWLRHAENTLLWELELPTERITALRTATLYTTMEPCPMCMGTCVMGNVRHLRYAARDPYCGAAHYKDTDPYMMGKQLDYTLAGGEMERVQIILQSCYELQNGVGKVLAAFEEMLPEAVRAARRLFASGTLQGLAAENAPADVAYDAICAVLSERI